jgi:thiamine-phosphate pyrophosphorylase
MRVMEEYARFVLDDQLLAFGCKEARHDLAECVRGFEETLRRTTSQSASGGLGLLIASRDIVGDVGQEVSTAAEMERKHTHEVAIAAGKRLSEALRSIEEYGKVLDSGFAARIEQLRYRGYELERRLALTVQARERFREVKLYVLLTESLCQRGWFETAQAALDGGADCIQLREKSLSDRELLDRARRLADLCRERGQMFIVNDRPDIAAASTASGVHVGQDDLPVVAVRRILPPGGVVGVSTHTPEQVEIAASQAPDCLAVGPMFPTQTKPQAHIATPELLKAARSLTSLPLVAIGGITL